ncbi:MAG TPA: polyketide synthase dehydratase domain-containing protein [Thermodesulfobacteriota bacterium]|nr:polyketide synthase dehydratase domain-containing protein [Thermodesulfobacteriota bacterium]
MDLVPQIDKKTRYPAAIEVSPYLRDHQFEGKVVLPAVESLIALARVVKLHFPQMRIDCLLKAGFPRFLSIAPETKRLDGWVDLENVDRDHIAAVFLTSMKSKKSGIGRTLEHARVEFAADDFPPCPETPFPVLEKLGGKCIRIPAATIYRELVPFGRAYQNILGDLAVSPEGALAHLSGGNYEADENLLGSPFPLDAAMHAACVWGQRFSELVPFPTGFEKRMIYQKTKKGGTYLGRVVPVKVDQESLMFDAWIHDLNGVLYEAVSGIKMRDVTQGRLHPPQWIKA